MDFNCCFLSFGRCEQEQQRQKQPPRPMGATDHDVHQSYHVPAQSCSFSSREKSRKHQYQHHTTSGSHPILKAAEIFLPARPPDQRPAPRPPCQSKPRPGRGGCGGSGRTPHRPPSVVVAPSRVPRRGGGRAAGVSGWPVIDVPAVGVRVGTAG